MLRPAPLRAAGPRTATAATASEHAQTRNTPPNMQRESVPLLISLWCSGLFNGNLYSSLAGLCTPPSEPRTPVARDSVLPRSGFRTPVAGFKSLIPAGWIGQSSPAVFPSSVLNLRKCQVQGAAWLWKMHSPVQQLILWVLTTQMGSRLPMPELARIEGYVRICRWIRDGTGIASSLLSRPSGPSALRRRRDAILGECSRLSRWTPP